MCWFLRRMPTRDCAWPICAQRPNIGLLEGIHVLVDGKDVIQAAADHMVQGTRNGAEPRREYGAAGIQELAFRRPWCNQGED